MRVTVVRPDDLGPSEASLWASFQRSSPELQNPFLSLTFMRLVGQSRPSARIAVVEADGAIAAFLAFDLGPGRMGMPIGYPMNNLQAFVGRGTPLDARRIIRKAGLRGWRFIAAPAQQLALAPHHYEGTAVEAPLIDLSDGYKSYYLSRSKKFLEDDRRHLRALERRVGPVSLEWGTSAPEHVRQLIEWKTARYGGARELFSDPVARRIVEEVSATRSADCGGLVNVLRAGERVVAVISGLTCQSGLSGWFTAYDEEMRKFSPGTLALLMTAEEAERRDITRIDMGAGQDSYKLRLANASYPVAGGAVWAFPGEQAARRIYRRLAPSP
ncbi:MAG: GNAT family N-acetyltransferase [Streptosporangiaceae bacterium]|jgi:CelD/BcsL family acetyltransferase involved in cellulose biosynthesis